MYAPYDVLTLLEWIKQFYTQSDGFVPQLYSDDYAYRTVVQLLPSAGASASANISINSNADFIITRITAQVISPSNETRNAAVDVAVKLQITNAASARPFFNQALPIMSFAQTGNENLYLMQPKFIKANSALTLQFSGYGAVTSNLANIEVALLGVSVQRNT